MPLVLIKEDGVGRVDANSYAAVADGDAYHLGHLYSSAWDGVSEDRKGTALVMATRLIDAYCRFRGARKTTVQALQWPRVEVVDPDADASALRVRLLEPTEVVYFASTVVPACVVQATCEQARELLKVDRTGAPLGEGLKESMVSGSMFIFDKHDRRPVLTATVEAMLSKVVSGSPGTATVRLVRS